MKATVLLALALAWAAASQESTTDRSLADGVLRLTLIEQVDMIPEARPKPELIKAPQESSKFSCPCGCPCESGGICHCDDCLCRICNGAAWDCVADAREGKVQLTINYSMPGRRLNYAEVGAKPKTCPANCDCAPCPLGDCDCGCGCSAKVQKKREEPKAVDLPAAFKHDFKHDCGCGSLPCNCNGPGGCHCAENRAENRQPMRWRSDGETWGLFRGKRQIGALDSKGVYHPYDEATGRWLPPTAMPVPLPQARAVFVRRAVSC